MIALYGIALDRNVSLRRSSFSFYALVIRSLFLTLVVSYYYSSIWGFFFFLFLFYFLSWDTASVCGLGRDTGMVRFHDCESHGGGGIGI
jgi:hypothetical protein